MTTVVGSAAIRFQPDFTGFRERLDSELSQMTSSLRSIRVGVDVDTTEARRRIDQLVANSRTVRIGVDVDTAGARAQLEVIDRLASEVDRRHIRIHVEITGTTEALAQLAAVAAALERIRGARADVSVGGGAGSAAGGLSGLAVALGALGPAAVATVSALVPLVGLAGALPGAFLGAASAVGVLKVAFAGIGDAVKTSDAAQTAAAQNAIKGAAGQGAAALAIASANDALANAQRGLASAQTQIARTAVDDARAISDAQRGVTDAIRVAAKTQAADLAAMALDNRTLEDALKAVQVAQNDLTQVRKDALITIRDLNNSEKDAALQLREANIALVTATRTRDAVDASGAFTTEQRARAQLTFEEAVQRQVEAQQKATDASQKALVANQKGVDQAPAVIAAQDKVTLARRTAGDAAAKVAADQQKLNDDAVAGREAIAKANEALTVSQQKAARDQADASDKIAAANQAVAAAHRQVAAAAATSSSATSTAADAALAAYNKLTPAGKAFVDAFKNLRNEFKPIGDAIKEATLPGFTAFLHDIGAVLPLVRVPLVDTGAALGDFTRGLGALVAGPFKADLPGLFATNTGLIKDLLGSSNGGGLTGVFTAITNIAVAAEPLVRRIGEAANHFGLWAASVTSGEQGRATLTSFFDKAYTRGALVVDIFKNLGLVFGDLFRSGDAAGAGILQTLDNLIKKVHDALSSANGQTQLKDVFDGASYAIGQLVSALGKLNFGILSAFFTSINTMASVIAFLVNNVPGVSTVMTLLVIPLGALAALSFAASALGLKKVFENLLLLAGRQLLTGISTLFTYLINNVGIIGDLYLRISYLLPALAGMAAPLAVAGAVAVAAGAFFWNAYGNAVDRVKKSLDDTNKAISIGTPQALDAQHKALEDAINGQQSAIDTYAKRNPFQRLIHLSSSTDASFADSNNNVGKMKDQLNALNDVRGITAKYGISVEDANRLQFKLSDGMVILSAKADLAHHSLGNLKDLLDTSTPRLNAYRTAEDALASTQDKIAQAQTGIRSALGLTNDAYSKVDTTAKITAASILTSFEANTKNIIQESANIKTLVDAGVPNDAIQSLVQKGPEYVAAVANAGKGVIHRFVQDYTDYNKAQHDTLATDSKANAAGMSQAFADELAGRKKAVQDAAIQGLQVPVNDVLTQIQNATKIGGGAGSAGFSQAMEAKKELTQSAIYRSLSVPMRHVLDEIIQNSYDSGVGGVQAMTDGIDGRKHLAVTAAQAMALGINAETIKILQDIGINVTLTDDASAGLRDLEALTVDLVNAGYVSKQQIATEVGIIRKGNRGYATGGPIYGAGTETSDSIPAMLSHGEFVVQAAAVKHVGIPFLQAINDSKMLGFAEGGAVSSGRLGLVSTVDVAAAAAAIKQAVTNNNGGMPISYSGGADTIGLIEQLAAPFISGLQVTSTFRPGGGSYHARSEAVDFSNGTDTPQEMYFDREFARRYGSSLAELIHAGGINIKDGRNVGDGMSTYGAATMAQHHNHVHVAISPESIARSGHPFSGIVSGGGGSAGANAALGRQIAGSLGWGNQYNAIDYIFSRESGWRSDAQNPSSSAYGIAQFLDSTWGPYGGKTSDPGRQITDGIRYMIDRYGSPNAAMTYWQNHHNYAVGGLVDGIGNGDTVRAMLTPGEYVIRRDVARKIGTPTLDRINQMGAKMADNLSRPTSTSAASASHSGPFIDTVVIRENVDADLMIQRLEFLTRAGRIG